MAYRSMFGPDMIDVRKYLDLKYDNIAKQADTQQNLAKTAQFEADTARQRTPFQNRLDKANAGLAAVRGTDIDRMSPLNARRQELENQFYRPLSESTINQRDAQADANTSLARTRDTELQLVNPDLVDAILGLLNNRRETVSVDRLGFGGYLR